MCQHCSKVDCGPTSCVTLRGSSSAISVPGDSQSIVPGGLRTRKTGKEVLYQPIAAVLGSGKEGTMTSIAKSSSDVRQTCPGHDVTSNPRKVSFTFLSLRLDDITLYICGSPRMTAVLNLTVDSTSCWISGQILLGTDK